MKRWLSTFRGNGAAISWCPFGHRSSLGRFRVFGPRRGDHAGRRTFQFCFYGRKHSGTESLVHIEVTGSSGGDVFDFRYAMKFVVAHLRTSSSLYVSLRLP